MNRQDIRFAKEMIDHHREAVEMAEQQLERGEDLELISIAENIIEVQSKEIKRFHNVLKRRLP